jgi:hypothetical protein
LLACGLTDAHLAIIAESPHAARLHQLHLAQYRGVSAAAAKQLFSSKYLGALAGLELSIPSFWPHGLDLLAGATQWQSLRDLELSGQGLTSPALIRFLDSPNCQQLVRLAIEDGNRGELVITTELVERLSRLPHLARLRLLINEIDADVQAQLKNLRGRVWSTFQCFNDPARFGAHPNEVPPLDVDLGDVDRYS